MDKVRPSVRELLRSLSSRGLFPETKLEAAGKFLSRTEGERPLPAYLQLFAIFGAWAAAAFFIGFLAITGVVEEDSAAIVGILLVGGATGLRRVARGIFVPQLCLALSAAGHSLALFGVGARTKSVGAAALAAVGLAAALYRLYPDPVHRFLSCGAALALLPAWALDAKLPHVLHAVILGEMAALGCLMTRRPQLPVWRPLTHALAIALPATLSLVAFSGLRIETPEWPSRVGLALGLLWLVAWLARGGLGREPVLLSLAAVALLAAFSAPGILASIGLLVLGYAARDRVLPGVGLLSLACFVFTFYYDLDVKLDVKSGILAGTGAVLLALRAVLLRRPWAGRETE